MTYRELYDAIGKILEMDPSVVRIAPQLPGGRWEQGVYSAIVLPTGPAPNFVKLQRKGGNKKELFFCEDPRLAEQLARIIDEHFRDPRNAT